MKMIKRILIILIIAATIFTMVKCNRIEDADNIKQEQGDTLPKEDKEDTNKKDEQNKEEKQEEENKDNEQDKEEIESPVELG